MKRLFDCANHYIQSGDWRMLETYIPLMTDFLRVTLDFISSKEEF